MTNNAIKEKRKEGRGKSVIGNIKRRESKGIRKVK